eukprot:CAMPEP_0197924250 /NCGR_PEP_ID=MMETSP1439-20131203/95364_1 /TAXON_ID=66791 /ORGANISM="Gonyaulax spinifera, Strain CCMP409" /LENGTH=77 /DNA_ID=CAMNT_0043546663 /DNA_START=55 /DNA_END=286 /DNA_ORIENTATION=-
MTIGADIAGTHAASNRQGWAEIQAASEADVVVSKCQTDAPAGTAPGAAGPMASLSAGGAYRPAAPQASLDAAAGTLE